MKLTISGVRYNIETWGEGEPLILLHGFTGSARSWKIFHNEWSMFKVYCLDIIGHGETEAPKTLDRYEMMSVVDDLFFIMEKLNLENANLLGYSMGGRLALSFACKYPQKLRKLILESSSPGLKTEEERKKRRENDEKLAQRILEKGMEHFVDYWENIPLFESQKRLPRETVAKLRQERLNNLPHGLANSLKGMGTGSQPSWWEELSSLHIDTLLITGELDEKFCKIAEEMGKLLPNGKHIVVENAGHNVHLEEKEKFAKIVSEFLIKT